MTPNEIYLAFANRIADPVLSVTPAGVVRSVNRSAGTQLGTILVPDVNLPEICADAANVKRLLKMASRSLTPLPGSIQFLGEPTRWRCDVSALPGLDQPIIVIHLRSAAESSRRFVALNDQIHQLQNEIKRRRQLETELNDALQKETETRLEAESANRLKDEFLASVSHELRTPLQTIAGWVAILREDPPPATRSRGLDVIDRNVLLETQLTEDLVDASLLFTGRMKLELEPLDLGLLIQNTVEGLKPRAEAKSQRLDSIAALDTCVLNGDPGRLVQIFSNLIGNAIKYTPEGGRVQVVMKRVNSHVEIYVSDSGEGISEELLPYVFDRFRRGDGSRTRRSGGLGIGLAVARHLAELHGGMIVAESDGAGQGSTFIVSLPLPMFNRAPAVTTDVSDSKQQLDGISILLVEDHDDSREVLASILESRGAVVLAIESSMAAQAAYASNAPDVIVSDIEMPDEDGFTMMRKIRRHEREVGQPPCPAIAVSAHTIAGARVHALKAGFQSFLSKPVQPAELVALIRSLTHQGDDEWTKS